jgi:hypothetical protein
MRGALGRAGSSPCRGLALPGERLGSSYAQSYPQHYILCISLWITPAELARSTICCIMQQCPRPAVLCCICATRMRVRVRKAMRSVRITHSRTHSPRTYERFSLTKGTTNENDSRSDGRRGRGPALGPIHARFAGERSRQ